MLTVTYRKGQQGKQTKRQELRRQALMMIDDEVSKWVMQCKPENRQEVKKRILDLMINSNDNQINP